MHIAHGQDLCQSILAKIAAQRRRGEEKGGRGEGEKAREKGEEGRRPKER